jgi:hypothetical protein
MADRQPPRTADPDEVKTFAAGLSDEYLECRTLSHNWRPFQAEWKRDEGAYLVVYLCHRCNTTRNQWLDRWGDVVKGNYEYDEGYQHKGMGRIVGRGRSALRLESLTRIMRTRTPINRATRKREAESSGN